MYQQIDLKMSCWYIDNGYGGTDFMKFRPCIDIHNGKVKQIVGGSLTDVQDQASENFVSEQDASFYAELYKKAGIKGGHVILLNGHDSPYYESTKEQALLALHTYPGGLQIGGGVNPENAEEYLNSPMPYIDETDEDAVADEMRERKQITSSLIEICDNGKLLMLIPVPKEE